MAKQAKPLIGVRNTGKVPNQKVAKSLIVLGLVLGKSFALVYLSHDGRFHPKNNTNQLRLLVSSTFSVLRQESMEPQISLFLTTVTLTGVSISLLLISYRRLLSVQPKNHEELEQFKILPLASFVAGRVLHAYWGSSYLSHR